MGSGRTRGSVRSGGGTRNVLEGTELTEVGVIHGLPGREAGLVVVAQQLVQEVQRLRADQVLVLAVDEALPPFTGVSGGGAENAGLAAATLADATLAAAALTERGCKTEAVPSQDVIEAWVQLDVVLVDVVVQVLCAQNLCNAHELHGGRESGQSLSL